MDCSSDKTTAFGCAVQKGLSNTSLLNVLHRHPSETSLQHTTTRSSTNESHSPRSGQNPSEVTDTHTSTSDHIDIGELGINSSSFFGGYPMFFTDDPLFRAFSPCNPDTATEHANAAESDDVWSNFMNPDRAAETPHGNPADEIFPQTNPANEIFAHGNPANEIFAHGDPANQIFAHGDPANEIFAHGDPANEIFARGDPANEIFAHGNPANEVFARKVFIGGLPFDVSQHEIIATFSQFGAMVVDWPYRSDGTPRTRLNHSSHAARSLKGYVFIVFEEERSVQNLVSRCHKDGGDYYLLVSSPTMRNKPVQVRPWRLTDITYKIVEHMDLDSRRTVFIGGVPRPTTAKDLARILQSVYGPVSYAGIDIDPELKYPKGAARVTFGTTNAFISAINGRFVNLATGGLTKRVELKPYLMDDQMCDECNGSQCVGRYAPYFCGDIECLQYFCEKCWTIRHTSDDRFNAHRPLVRNGDQIKQLPDPPRSRNVAVYRPPQPHEGLLLSGTGQPNYMPNITTSAQLRFAPSHPI